MIITEKNHELQILDEEKNIIYSVKIQDNLDNALDLLKRINYIKTNDGIELCDIATISGKSIWSFFQAQIFWNDLRYFVQIKDLLNKITSYQSNSITFENISPPYEKLFKKLGFIKQKRKLFQGKKENIARIIAYGISFSSAIYTRIKKTKVLIYTPDNYNQLSGCDFRFAEIYQFLKKQNINYLEIFHTNLGKKWFNNLLQRGRHAIFLESLATASKNKKKLPTFNLDQFDKIETRLIKNLLENFWDDIPRRIKLYQNLVSLLHISGIKQFIAIDDTRYTNEIILACNTLNIPAYGIQHGHYTKYLVGYHNYNIPKQKSVTFSTLFVWNMYWYNTLTKYSSQYQKNNVLIGGILRSFNLKKEQRPLPNNLNETTILVLAEPLANAWEIGHYIQDLLISGATIYLSIRPDAPSIPKILSAYELTSHQNLHIITKIDNEILSKVDAVAGSYSTFLHEMLYYQLPILLFSTSFSQGHVLIDDCLVLPISYDEYDKIIPYIHQHKNHKNYVWPKSPEIRNTLKNIIT